MEGPGDGIREVKEGILLDENDRPIGPSRTDASHSTSSVRFQTSFGGGISPVMKVFVVFGGLAVLSFGILVAAAVAAFVILGLIIRTLLGGRRR